jgi:FMN-dependent dehydrogenase
MGKAVLSQGHHEHCGRKAWRGHRRDRHHGVQSWRAQLDGSRSPFDQLAEIVVAVGDRIDVICDGGITRGTVLKALSWARRRVREGGFICMLWRPPVRPALRGHLKISGPKSNAT